MSKLQLAEKPIGEMEDQRLARVVAWLSEANPETAKIDNDADLFESGLVTSIQFVELVLLIEELCGEEIMVDDGAVDRFRTLRAIADNYFR